MALSANDPRPPYRQIADELIAQIANGDVVPGGKLPSARDLMQRYDVANQTVQSALRVLRTQGLINSVPGRGTFVSEEIDLDALAVTVSDDSRPSPEFVALNERLDTLAGELQSVQDRLERIESARSKPKSPARKR
ncbi:MAG: winged helix-turn-helix transcriptional regulator [bacterium]|nr:winged helix-turn-helix transcriptional regulator [bacterium]